MSKRVTIMIDESNDRKLRLRQAKEIKETSATCSYSRVINEVLAKALK